MPSNEPLYRCTFIPGFPGSYGERCTDAATVLLLGPDGVAVPGGQHCEAHAQLVCEEYREKLGESWSYMPLAAPRGWEVAETSVEDAPLRIGDTVLCVDDSASFNRLRAGTTYVVEANFDGSPTIMVNGSAHSLERFVKA